MFTEIKFAELQTPLFLEGVNHGVKLDPTKRQISLFWDEKREMLVIRFKDAVSLVPYGNIANMSPKDSAPFLNEIYKKTENKESTVKVMADTPSATRGRPIKAQVSTPTSHVFSGEKQT